MHENLHILQSTDVSWHSVRQAKGKEIGNPSGRIEMGDTHKGTKNIVWKEEGA